MITLSDFQKESISNLLSDIDNKILKLKFNNCLCKNQNVGNDIIISEKDRYGIPVKNLICSKCGLIRSEKIFNDESNINFYKYYYRNIYVGLNKPNDQFFEEQVKSLLIMYVFPVAFDTILSVSITKQSHESHLFLHRLYPCFSLSVRSDFIA